MPTVALPPGRMVLEIMPLYEAAAQDRLRSLMTLAGGLAHALRSPLTAIMGRAELIGVRQPELREQMHTLVSECERINGILQAATAKLALEATAESQPVNLTDLVERECQYMCFDRHFKHEITKEYALAAELPSVSAVYGTLARAFAALVRNAVIAMHLAPARRLGITTEAAGDAVSLSIRDSGCGIAAGNLQRIFEPGFTTFDGERYGPKPVEQSGRGYGLSYAAAVVHGCGGTIAVTSEPGAGTTVTVTLPVS